MLFKLLAVPQSLLFKQEFGKEGEEIGCFSFSIFWGGQLFSVCLFYLDLRQEE